MKVDIAGNVSLVKRLGGLYAKFIDSTLMGKAMIYSDTVSVEDREGGLEGTRSPILFLTDGTADGTVSAPQDFGGISNTRPSGQVGNTLIYSSRLSYMSTVDGIVETEVPRLESNLDLALDVNTLRLRDFAPFGTNSSSTLISDGISSHLIPIDFLSGGSHTFFQNKMIGSCVDDRSSVCASQGTSSSLEKIATFDGASLNSLSNFAQTQNGVYFQGQRGELWVTDGTAPGTRFIRDFGDNRFLSLRRSSATVNSISAAQLGEKLFFNLLGTGDQETELWVTDGSETGTFRIRYFYDDGTPREIVTGNRRWIASILDLLLGE